MPTTRFICHGAVVASALCCALAPAIACRAATLEVAVADDQGKPLARVAVHVTARGEGVSPVTQERSAVMDQVDQRFDPHLIIVERGTSVVFPNNDDVSHHVYSFSPAKPFEFPLYKGDVYPPVVFDTPGIVVVGCNIHDGMLGYIVVVATPHFALTDERGMARLTVPAGDYSLEAWTPRARPAGLPPPQALTILTDGLTTAEVRINGRLAPDHDHPSSSLSWKRY